MCVVPGTWPAGLASHVHENYTQVWLHTNHSTVGSDSRPTSMTGHSMAPPHHYCALWYTVLIDYRSRTTDMHSLRYFILPQWGWTPLHRAVGQDDTLKGKERGRYTLPFVELLIKAGADIHAQDKVGCLGPGMFSRLCTDKHLMGPTPYETNARGRRGCYPVMRDDATLSRCCHL